jgi:outer membrane protein TolC
MAQQSARTARMAQLPDLNVGLKAGFVGQPIVWQQGLANPLYPEAPDYSQNYAIDLAQPIYQGGRLSGGIRKADIEKEIAEWQTSTDRAVVKLGLLNQYLNLFALYKQREILQRDIEEAERRLHDIRRMKAEGLITNNDVLRSEMQLTNERLSKQETENSIALVSQQLNLLLMNPNDLVIIQPDTTLLQESMPLSNYEAYIADGISYNPELNGRYAQQRLAENDVRLSRAAFLPSLSLYASNTLARPVSRTLADMYNNNWNVGLSLSYSLSSLYKSTHKLKESKLMVSLRRNAVDQQVQQLQMDVRTAYLRHQEALDRVASLKLSAQQAQENYRIMQNRYLNQLAILTDLLDADTVRLNVEWQLVTARTRVVYTYYQLQKACGML